MNRSPTPDEQRDRLVFYPVAVVGVLFCVTVLMVIASTFGDQQAPVSKWLNKSATTLLLVETACLVGVAVLAMSLDRVRTKRRLNRIREARHTHEPAKVETGSGDTNVG